MATFATYVLKDYYERLNGKRQEIYRNTIRQNVSKYNMRADVP